MAGRFPHSVYGEGTPPDPRFSLANERTFLAWTRTALGLMAAGVALAALPVDVREPFGRIAAIALVVLGIAVAGHAWIGWLRTERALRHGRALPGAAGFSLVVTIVVALVGLALLVDGVR